MKRSLILLFIMLSLNQLMAQDWVIINSNAGDCSFANAWFRSPDTAVLIAGFKIYRTTNGCKTFTNVFTHQDFGGALSPLSFPSSRVGYTGGATSSGAYITKTTDGGITWADLPSPGGFALNGIWFLDETTGILAGDNTIMKTVDGGTTWSDVRNGQNLPWLFSVCFADQETGYIGGDNGCILKTTNGGNSWLKVHTSVTTRQWLMTICSPDPNIVYAAGYTAYDSACIVKTVNGGFSWTTLRAPTKFAINRIFFTDALTGHAACDSGIVLKTIDGGISWTTEHLWKYSVLSSISFLNDTIGFVVGTQGVVYKTINGGGPGHSSSVQNHPEEFSISPNPVTDFIRVSCQTITPETWLTIYSHDGRIILESKISTKVSGFNLSSFPDGLYVAVLKTSGGKIVRKFLKTN